MEQTPVSCAGHCSDKNRAVKVVGILVVGTVLVIQILSNTDVFSNKNNYDTISITGQGRVPVRPDAALVNLGVTVIKADTSEAAVRETSDKITKISEAVGTLGIPEENRLITGYAVSPHYTGGSPDKPDTIPTIDGYTASQQITVRIPGIAQDKDLINKVIEIAAQQGANQIGEVKFIATDAEALKQEARLKALEDAQSKAGHMADTVGVKLEGVSSWSENVVSAPNQGYPNQNYSSGNTDSQVVQGVTPPSGIIVLQPGQLDMIVELNVNFNIENHEGFLGKKK